MGYYTRVFCASDSRPTLAALEDSLRQENPQIKIVTDDDRNSTSWQNAEYIYNPAKQPIVLECNVNNSSDSLANSECQEFIEKIGGPGLSFSKQRVLSHLNKTRYIISCQLLGDIEDDGYHLNGELMLHFLKHYDGLIQADGEGFYEGRNLVVPLK